MGSRFAGLVDFNTTTYGTSDMVKYVSFIKRRKDLTHEQFKEYWLKNHSILEKMVLETTPARKIVANFIKSVSASSGEQPEFDGFVEIIFDNDEGLKAMRSSEMPAKMQEDERNFVDPAAPKVRYTVEEYVIGEKQK